jgi:3-oxoacyl-[acyl-carrier protein] reductase
MSFDSDRLVSFANHPWAQVALRELGLPRPRPLRRMTAAYDPQELRGRGPLIVALPGGFAQDACRAFFGQAGATLVEEGAVDTVVLDATGCLAVADLQMLHGLLQPALKRLADGGRVLLLARGGELPPEAAACARAIEGAMRSLGKEIGRRGATANCVFLTEAALPGLPAVLGFFCGDRSAYVSGQALHLRGCAGVPMQWPVLARRTAVVTGAAAGIGAATALRLAAEGAHVVCIDRPEAQATLGAIAAQAQGSALALDITRPDAGRRLVEAVLPRGGVDVLVHNAGITRDRTFGRMSSAEWDTVLAVNLRAVLALDAALDAAGALREGGREICLASISGIAGNAGQSNYAASKAALTGYVAARARELAPRGITVNAVAPGFIESAMTQNIPLMTREAGRRLNSLMQGGQPADVAEAIAFLARPDAGCVSGQTLRVCGQSVLGA